MRSVLLITVFVLLPEDHIPVFVRVFKVSIVQEEGKIM